MKTKTLLLLILAIALTLPVATLIIAAQAGAGPSGTPARPEGPCDIYAAAGAPCVAAHSSTRALYASYNGPLYQVMRQSDGKTLDIGVVQPSGSDPGGYADAAAQDAFCANTVCWITKLYDQSGNGNHLIQAPRGGFSGPALGGFNNLPIADMAPVTLNGHKVYGVFIAPGMGLRQNDAKGTAVDDQAEGQYWVINGHHYNGGCCFDYGNAETDSRDDGDGTMETTYFGNATAWYRGQPPGPWIMSDQENNLVGCVNESPNDKFCTNLPSITWRFVMATMDGEPGHWRTMGGDAQQGELKVMFDGPRIKNPRSTYDPMRKQGAIVLGNGGDNSRGSQGTFYEGAMTAANTFPSQETQQKVQANVVAARYDVQRLSIAPASATTEPPGLQTFTPRSSQETVVTFKNTSAFPATGVRLSIAVPSGWTSVVSGSTETIKTFAEPVAPGGVASATFRVTSGPAPFNGDIVGKATWTANGMTYSESVSEKVRNVNPIKINEFAINAGTPDNATDSFIELYNAGDTPVDLSNWTLTHHASTLPIFSSIKVPAGTTIPPRGFYVFGLATSGLAVPAKKGDSTLYVRSVTGLKVGDTIEIGTGANKETRRIATLGTAAGNPTTVWQPLPDGPVLTIPVGSTNIPFTGGPGVVFEVGQKIAIGYGSTFPDVANTIAKYEVVTVTEVGKPGTQAWTAADTKPGDTNVKVSSVENISVGERIRLGYNTLDHGVEWVTVTKVGTRSAFNPNYPERSTNRDPGTGLDLAEPLKFHHSANMPFNARGSGISFEPATKYVHISNEPILPLGTGITLDRPLSNDHEIHDVIRNAAVTTAGFQGKADQWFGGPVLGGNGSIVLRDAAGLVVDSLNYGELADPWAAEGYQATSPGGGCFAASPGGGGGFGARRGGPGAGAISRSSGRFPDGADTDSNCNDFSVQTAVTLAAGANAGDNNIKVASVAGLSVGQTIVIDSGANRETATIATIGTPGATVMSSATEAGATVIPVANAANFSPGQTITIDSGTNLETAIVASTTGGRRGGRGGAPGGATITVSSPLKYAHAFGAQVSGSGITLTAALSKSHATGARVVGGLPTPGAPNQYARRTR
ncbi:MAG TPA: alpha-N-arabinofuranosidase [Verrucomicrobia bacterium]|nr:alpha-N-arabinofuranosidase [Verrucomicrobiota bacterium]HOP98352.1 arabinofuranosidase catalytic domain-containing protein [Verrucomicrobiota bacterium]